MDNYVKIECEVQGVHKNWFLEYKGNKNLLEDLKLSDRPQERRIKERLVLTRSESHEVDKGYDRSDIGTICLLAAKSIDYNVLYERIGKPLYIRETGSWMYLTDMTKIVDRIESNHFPVPAHDADIVICENDRYCEYRWKNYLKERFPNKSIKVINFFNTRTDTEIKEYFKGVELITFSTTFSDFEWFKNAIKNKSDHQKVLGYSHDSEKWEQAKEIYSDIDIINHL